MYYNNASVWDLARFNGSVCIYAPFHLFADVKNQFKDIIVSTHLIHNFALLLCNLSTKP